LFPRKAAKMPEAKAAWELDNALGENGPAEPISRARYCPPDHAVSPQRRSLHNQANYQAAGPASPGAARDQKTEKPTE